MTCPFLDYRELPDVDTPEDRAYCTAAEQFVQPLRADVCNDRYDLVHDEHCEIYQEHADASEAVADAMGDKTTDE